MSQQPSESQHAIFSYCLGFSISIILTIAAFLAVGQQWLAGNGLVAFIATLAFVQLFVQLVFFLHLGSEAKPRLRLLTFLAMAVVVGIVVAGSLWIMNNLNYHGHSAEQAEERILKDEGIKP